MRTSFHCLLGHALRIFEASEHKAGATEKLADGRDMDKISAPDLLLDDFLSFSETAHRLLDPAEPSQHESGKGERERNQMFDVSRLDQSKPLLDPCLCLRPVSPAGIKRNRDEMDVRDGEGIFRLLGELGGLGFACCRLLEPADSIETEDQVRTGQDRDGYGAANDIPQDPIRGQCCENIGGKLNCADQVTPMEMQLHQIGRCKEAEIEILSLRCDFQSASCECLRLIEFTELLVGSPHESQDATLPASIVQALDNAFGLTQVVNYFMALIQLEQYCPQLEANVDDLLQGGAVLGQRPQEVERLLKPNPCLVKRLASH